MADLIKANNNFNKNKRLEEGGEVFSQVKDLFSNSKQVNIKLKLVASEPYYAKGYKVVMFIGSDSTGEIPIPFFNIDANDLKVGDVIEILNVYFS